MVSLMSQGNHRLRSVMAALDVSTADLASRVGADPKTVERWLTRGRVPHPSTRVRVAQVLGRDETFLWPELLGGSRAISSSSSELVQMWPTRSAAEPAVWRALMASARERLDVLVYSGGFLVEVLQLVEVIRRGVPLGLRVRVLLGDPESEAVRSRGVDEGLPSLPARCASTAEYLSPVMGLEGVEMRVHDTPLYASLYGFDDSWLVNTHTHGVPAMDSPLLHWQRVPGGLMVPYYEAAFERVWQVGRPIA